MSSSPTQATNFSFECQFGKVCGPTATDPWPTTTAQPGTVRLWDSGTNWALTETAAGTYDWTVIDQWLDLVATRQPRMVLYTFGHVPCWITTGTCTGNGWGSGQNWSPAPPRDLNSNGSASFNAFVTALVEHCSPAGHCVKDYIKYWEMWNEANLTSYWTGSIQQLYNMFKAAVPIIRAHVSGAIVSTPPVCGGNTTWMGEWLSLENNNTRLSDYYGFHVYIENYEPETRLKMVERMINTKNEAGWTKAPWMDTETNFINTNDQCASQYSKTQCAAMLVRWHVLLYAYQGGAGGAYLVSWYNWGESMPDAYDSYYYTMMQWLTGATFSASCSNNGNVYTCPLKESGGKQALVVWNAGGNSSYKPASGYVDYKAFNGTYGGTTEKISSGESVTIGIVPIMLEE